MKKISNLLIPILILIFFTTCHKKEDDDYIRIRKNDFDKILKKLEDLNYFENEMSTTEYHGMINTAFSCKEYKNYLGKSIQKMKVGLFYKYYDYKAKIDSISSSNNSWDKKLNAIDSINNVFKSELKTLLNKSEEDYFLSYYSNIEYEKGQPTISMPNNKELSLRLILAKLELERLLSSGYHGILHANFGDVMIQCGEEVDTNVYNKFSEDVEDWWK